MNNDYWQRNASHYFNLDGELKLTVLHPSIIDQLGNIKRKKVLDFGCGEGSLAKSMADKGAWILAVDKSETTLEKAINEYSCEKNILFKKVCPQYNDIYTYMPFDIIVVSLVIVTVSSESESMEIFSVLSKALKPNGRIILAETHPCFQNQSYSTFSMGLDLYNNYRIDNTPYPVQIFDGYNPQKNVQFSDYHRSLSTLCSYFTKNGFYLSSITELYDNIEDNGLDPFIKSNFNEAIPPFIIIEGIKK